MCLNVKIIIITFIYILTMSTQEVKIRRKKDILIILIDDLRHLADNTMYLPNLQNLAATGFNFENAFAQQALCAPSRNSLLTGRRPDALHLYDFYSYWRDSVGNFTTMPQFFKERGYNTYSVGKIFHPGPSSNYNDDYPYSWSHLPYHPSTEKYKDAPLCKDITTKKLQSNLICPVNVRDQPQKTLPDIQILKQAVKILRKKMNSKKPFLLAVGFHKPHIPLKFPKRYLAEVPFEKVKPPKFPNIPKLMPMVSWHPWTDVRRRDDINRLNVSFPFGIMPIKWTIKIRQSYYAAAKYLDDLIGILMRYVDMRNTVVVLTSDHGWSLGENGLWAKYSNFDVAVKVPLIFNIPGQFLNSTITTPVELVDIFPTLVDLIGFNETVPKCQKGNTVLCFDGKSLVTLMENTTRRYGNEFSEFAISQYPRPSVYPEFNSDKPRLKDITIMGYSIRTKRFRYTEWISFNNTLFTRNWNKIFGIELYDHIIDPYEHYNLNNSWKYNDIKTHLSNILRLNVELIK